VADEHLRPVTHEELTRDLAYALRFNGRRAHFRNADEFMAQITAEHLARHLELSGFVVMKRPPQRGHG